MQFHVKVDHVHPVHKDVSNLSVLKIRHSKNDKGLRTLLVDFNEISK
jgi:hypothetical protein